MTSWNRMYTIGGTVPTTGSIYIERRVDDELLDMCLTGEYLHILSPTQMGKSSLIINIAKKLETHGVIAIYIDLTVFGVELDPEKWFLGFLYEICRSLSPSLDIYDWWQKNASLSFTQRVFLFIKDVLSTTYDKQIVIFIDEIDIILTASLANDFFALIRSLHSERETYKKLSKISVVLVGISTIQELTKNVVRLLNIGRTIQVSNFGIEEAIPLAMEFCGSGSEAKKILKWVFRWTNGHPYLTQIICANLYSISSSEKINKNTVDQIVKKAFLSGLDNPNSNIIYMHKKLIEHFDNDSKLLKIYERILNGEVTTSEYNSYGVIPLKSVGLVIANRDKVQVSNKIYASIFNKNWLYTHFLQTTHKPIEPNKTVFISYRRSEGKYAARAVYQHLVTQGFDVFFDVENIPSGEFESIILNQIASRVHFVVILNPGSLERCKSPNDWLRKEIEFALVLKRNIVPLLFDGFNFGDNEKNLTGNLSTLANYNGLEVTNELFRQTMDELISRYFHLNNPIDITPPPDDDLPIILEKLKKTREMLLK